MNSNFGTSYLTANMPNYDGLTWEKTHSWNAGLDLSLWDNRVEFIFDIYRKDTKDLLLQTALPWYTGTHVTGGTSAQWANVGSMRNEGIDIEVRCVLEKNVERCKQLGVDLSVVTTDMDRVVNDPEISVVAEFFGGIEPARTFLIRALEAGKSIVTANKEMFSKHWHELEAAAEKGGGGLYFEASCAGGIPIIRALTDGMQGNAVTSVKGIVNGTTNYILSRMSEEGVDYAECLKAAQELGYAEANPTADVDGFDAMYKNSILSSLAYKRRVPVDMIYREGISSVSGFQ